MEGLELAIIELTRIYKILNDKYFKGQLPDIIIAIQHQGRKRNVLGWCTNQEIWRDSSNQTKKYEITITAEYLNRPMLDIAETMLHQMVHLQNSVDGIKDTARSGSYHNKKYKYAAEAAGLKCTLSKSYGWSETELMPETLKYIKTLSLQESGFALARLTETKAQQQRSSSRKYTCPYCGITVRATREVSIICKECGVQLTKDTS